MAILEIKKFECPVLRDTLLAPVMLSPLMAGALIQRLSYFWVFGAGAVLMGLSLVMALCLRDPRYHPEGMCRQGRRDRDLPR